MRYSFSLYFYFYASARTSLAMADSKVDDSQSGLVLSITLSPPCVSTWFEHFVVGVECEGFAN